MATQLLEPKRETDALQTNHIQPSRVTDTVMVLVMISVVAMRMRLLNHAWFFVDDWPLA